MSAFAAPGQRSRPGVSAAKLADEDDDADVSVVGYTCNLYRDDATATALDKSEHLMLWMDNKDENLWIDRYDARLLLDDLSSFSNKKRSSPVVIQKEDEMEKILDAERYRFLPSEAEQEAFGAIQEEPAPEESETADTQRPASAFHFSFDSQPQTQAPQQPQETVPEILELAKRLGLRPDSRLPTNRKQHLSIEKTAKFVLKQGQKMEAVLKVKHGGNPAFAFLLWDNPLQPYYQAVLSHLRSNPADAALPSLLPPEEQQQPAAAEQPPPSSSSAAGAEAGTEEERKSPVLDGKEGAGAGAGGEGGGAAAAGALPAASAEKAVTETENNVTEKAVPEKPATVETAPAKVEAAVAGGVKAGAEVPKEGGGGSGGNWRGG